MIRSYKQQVALLLDILPEVFKEKCFALHGGTAINLFVRDMPRLSVDIDLTYILDDNRQQARENIINALSNIKRYIEQLNPDANITLQVEEMKLIITTSTALVKIEVNQANRGVIDSPIEMTLCENAQNEYGVFCAIPVVRMNQLYGGKICAALDRQHPRDLFDVKILLENEGYTSEIKEGLMLAILSSNRPISELLWPNFVNQEQALKNQFARMTNLPFSYKDFEHTRFEMLKLIHESLNDKDKEFLMAFKQGAPNWEIYNFERFPAVQWKLKNIIRLKNQNPEKHKNTVDKLELVLQDIKNKNT